MQILHFHSVIFNRFQGLAFVLLELSLAEFDLGSCDRVELSDLRLEQSYLFLAFVYFIFILVLFFKLGLDEEVDVRPTSCLILDFEAGLAEGLFKHHLVVRLFVEAALVLFDLLLQALLTIFDLAQLLVHASLALLRFRYFELHCLYCFVEFSAVRVYYSVCDYIPSRNVVVEDGVGLQVFFVVFEVDGGGTQIDSKVSQLD